RPLFRESHAARVGHRAVLGCDNALPSASATGAQLMVRAIPPRWRKPLQYLVTIGLMAVLAATVDWHDVLRLLRRATPELLALLLVVYVVDRCFMAWKWHLLARTTGTAPGLWTSTRIYVGSSVAGIALPLGGLGPDVVRTMLLTREGMPSEHAVSSILVERLCGIAGAAMMLLFAG